MKLNADVTKLTSKDTGIDIAKDSNHSNEAERAKKSNQNSSAVTVSSAMFDKTKKVLDEVAIVDKNRVKEIKEQIKKGQYNIEPDKIADQMLRESILEREVS